MYVQTASCLLYARCDPRQANQADVVAHVAGRSGIRWTIVWRPVRGPRRRLGWSGTTAPDYL